MVQDISLDQVAGSLGSILLLWSAIEQAARHEVVKANQGPLLKSAHGVSAALNAWEAAVVDGKDPSHFRLLLTTTLRAQLQAPLDIRNGVCHGLVGLSAAHVGRPARLTWELNGKRRSITWDELQVTFSWLSKIPSAIGIISNSPSQMLGSRMTDNEENREWWKAEYGLNLPFQQQSSSL